MSECIFDMTALSHLRDSIVDIIKHQTEKELEPSKKLLQRIDERALVSSFFLSFSLFYPLSYSLSFSLPFYPFDCCTLCLEDFYSHIVLITLFYLFYFFIQYICVGKTFFKRRDPIDGLTEKEIKIQLLAEQSSVCDSSTESPVHTHKKFNNNDIIYEDNEEDNGDDCDGNGDVKFSPGCSMFSMTHSHSRSYPRDNQWGTTTCR